MEAPTLTKPNKPNNMGDVKNPTMEQIKPITLHTICFLIIPMTPNNRPKGTNTGAKTKMLMTPNTNDAIPIALPVSFLKMIVCVFEFASRFISSFLSRFAPLVKPST